MRTNEGGWPWRWLRAGADLEGWGQSSTTYREVSYETLPPLPDVTALGSFGWLRGAPVSAHGLEFAPEAEGGAAAENVAPTTGTTPTWVETRLGAIVTEANERGVTVPAGLVAFFGHPELYRRVATSTGCYLDVPRALIPLEGHAGCLLRFMNDAHCRYCWYVFLQPDGGHRVVYATPEVDDEASGETLEDVSSPTHVVFCAASFEEFVHRMWIENTIWFARASALGKAHTLTKEHAGYAAALDKV